jgi:protein tyrosine phosphatase (PTP) superfamily phosphohydrolase (DUF442 family)
MRIRRRALFVLITVLALAGVAAALLELKGVHVPALLTGSRSAALPLEETAEPPPAEAPPAPAATSSSAEPPAAPPAKAPRTATRPATWAQPLRRPGLPNFFKVNDNLYRGAQPTAEGFRELKALGVKTVVNLRATESDRTGLEGTGLDCRRIPVEPFTLGPSDIVQFLKIVTDKTRTPVFVHCQAGADRTGTMCAAYRIAVQGWTKEEALREMTAGGFGYHLAWANLLTLVRGLDIADLRRQAGLEAVPGNQDPGSDTGGKPGPGGGCARVFWHMLSVVTLSDSEG